MLLAYVKITIAVNDRQKALDALMEEVPIVTAMPGCLIFSPYLDPANDKILFIFHEWEHEDNFATYLSSSCFANANSVLGPLFTAPAVSCRFDAQLIQ